MEWISVKDRLPENGVNVICVDHGDGLPPLVYISRYNSSNLKFERYDNRVEGDRILQYHFGNVTHWMPFPEPPNLK